jgi:hypothetical protein
MFISPKVCPEGHYPTKNCKGMSAVIHPNRRPELLAHGQQVIGCTLLRQQAKGIIWSYAPGGFSLKIIATLKETRMRPGMAHN